METDVLAQLLVHYPNIHAISSVSMLLVQRIIPIFWLCVFVEKQVFKYDDIGIVSRVSVNGRLFVIPKEELDGLVSTVYTLCKICKYSCGL